MKRVATWILLGLAPALLAEQTLHAQDPAAPATATADPLFPGQTIDGNLTLRNLDGQTVRLKELVDKVTVINFFSVDAKAQEAANARLTALQKEFPKVRFVHIDSCNREIGMRPPKVKKAADDGKPTVQPYARIRKHLARHELPFEVFADHQHVVADALEAKTTPHLFILDADRRLIYRGADDFEKDGKVAAMLRKLLAGKTVRPHEAPPRGTPIPRVLKAVGGHTLVIDDVDLAIETARREGKLLLYNFTAYNCGNCRIVEQSTFKKEPLRQLLCDHFVEARLHTDVQNILTITHLNANRNLQLKLTGIRANPTYIAADPIKDTTFGQIVLSGSWNGWTQLIADSLRQSAIDAGRKVQ